MEIATRPSHSHLNSADYISTTSLHFGYQPTSQEIASAARGELKTKHELNALQDRMKTLHLQLLHYRSIQTPLRQFPTEVLHAIFYDFCRTHMEIVSRAEDHHFRGALTLAQVCSRWRSIVMDTPILWSFIRLDLDWGADLDGRIYRRITWLGRYTTLSEQLPLHVHLRFPDYPAHCSSDGELDEKGRLDKYDLSTQLYEIASAISYRWKLLRFSNVCDEMDRALEHGLGDDGSVGLGGRVDEIEIHRLQGTIYRYRPTQPDLPRFFTVIQDTSTLTVLRASSVGQYIITGKTFPCVKEFHGERLEKPWSWLVRLPNATTAYLSRCLVTEKDYHYPTLSALKYLWLSRMYSDNTEDISSPFLHLPNVTQLFVEETTRHPFRSFFVGSWPVEMQLTHLTLKDISAMEGEDLLSICRAAPKLQSLNLIRSRQETYEFISAGMLDFLVHHRFREDPWLPELKAHRIVSRNPLMASQLAYILERTFFTDNANRLAFPSIEYAYILAVCPEGTEGPLSNAGLWERGVDSTVGTAVFPLAW